MEYSKYPNYKKSKTIKVDKKKTKKTIIGLKGKTKYYVRVRKVKKKADGKHVTEWSKARKVKTR